MAKSLRDITPKSPREGQFSGKRSSKVASPKIDDTNLYTWAGGKDGIDFIKKHEIETHDYPYDAEAAFTAGKVKKAEMERHGHEPKPKDVKVYKKANEETDHLSEADRCNMTESGVFCEVHGEQNCPSGKGSNQKAKPGQKLLTDKKRLNEILNNFSIEKNSTRNKILTKESLAFSMLETGKKKKILKKEQTDTPMTYPSGNIGGDMPGPSLGGKV